MLLLLHAVHTSQQSLLCCSAASSSALHCWWVLLLLLLLLLHPAHTAELIRPPVGMFPLIMTHCAAAAASCPHWLQQS
jgi:hypothetical protein